MSTKGYSMEEVNKIVEQVVAKGRNDTTSIGYTRDNFNKVEKEAIGKGIQEVRKEMQKMKDGIVEEAKAIRSDMDKDTNHICADMPIMMQEIIHDAEVYVESMTKK